MLEGEWNKNEFKDWFQNDKNRYKKRLEYKLFFNDHVYLQKNEENDWFFCLYIFNYAEDIK